MKLDCNNCLIITGTVKLWDKCYSYLGMKNLNILFNNFVDGLGELRNVSMEHTLLLVV